jgi:ribonuclease BN (tRNA processing enzyme)
MVTLMAKTPVSVALRTYQVGFGDCFLLSFKYGGTNPEERHVLIDFGTTGQPKTAPPMKMIAEDIANRCKNKLHVVVATHRHADHISGFSGATGKIIAGLHPDVVLQPWTEDPTAATGARRPTALKAASKGFVASLARMHGVATQALEEIRRFPARKSVMKQVAFIGEDNLKNLDAVRNLSQRMSGTKVYAYYGSDAGLAKVLPGVKVHVLGPPTLEQSDAIEQQRAKDPAEFWHFQEQASKASAGHVPNAFRRWRQIPRAHVPVQTRWFLSRLDAVRGEQLLEIVRILDDAMNNTSLILLLEVGGKKLLFPGDAQIENWLYALTAAPDKTRVRELLRDVHVYKVGHHGSLNATPKSLWKLFDHKSEKDSAGRLQSFMSTMSGKHGSTAQGTEVPRSKLVEALESETAHFSTQSLTKKAEFFREFEIKVRA